MGRTGRGLLPLSLAVLTVGLASSAAAAAVLHRDDARAERLRATGVPVEAAITGWSSQQRSKTADYVTVEYTYHGETHHASTRCGKGGCPAPPAPTVRIFLDPRHPADFVTEDGNTEDAELATPWQFLFTGYLTLTGAAGTWIALASRRRSRVGPGSGL